MTGASLSGQALPGRTRAELAWRRFGHLVLRPVLAVLVLSVLILFGLALRLTVGPIDVTWLVHAVTPLELGGNAQAQPALPPQGRLEIGRARLAWQGFHDGPSSLVAIRLDDVAIRRANGTIVDHLDRTRISLVTSALLRGRLQVAEVTASGARLNLRRDAQNGIGLGLAPIGQASGGGSSGPEIAWDVLSRVHVSDVQLTVHDLIVGQDWNVRDIDIDVRPPLAGRQVRQMRGGIVGRFGLTLIVGGRRSVLRGSGSALVATEPGDVIWHVTTDPLVPSLLAGSLPVLAPLAVATLPILPALDVTFANGPGRFMEPMRADLSLGLGRGALHVGRMLQVQDGQVTLQAVLPDNPRDGVMLRLLQADLRLRDQSDAANAPTTGPSLHAEGTLTLDRIGDAQRIRARLALDVPRIGFTELGQYWPEGVAEGARHWITANITGGQARGLHIETWLASDHGWGSLAESRRRGGFDADDMTLWWLRPIAPLRASCAHLSFQNTDAVLITMPQATIPVDGGQGAVPGRTINVSRGSMQIVGLDARDQIATLNARLTGDLGNLLTELSHPRLKLLSRHPLLFTRPSGRSVTDFTLTLPLDSNVLVDALKVSVHSEMSGVHLGQVAAGRSLNQARLSLLATADGVSLQGQGLFGAIPSRLRYAMDFRGGPPQQLVEQAHVEATVTPEALRCEGLNPSDDVAGSGDLMVDYVSHRSGQSSVTLGLDLTDLDVSTQVWSKRRGQQADASAVIELQNGRLASVEHIHAFGPGLKVEARAVITNRRASQVVVGHFELGRSSGAGRIELPARSSGPLVVTMHGPVLDLTDAIDGRRPVTGAPDTVHPAKSAKPRSKLAWTADLAFGRVYVGPTVSLAGVSAHLQDDGTRIMAAQLDASGPTSLSACLAPDGTGRRLLATAGDTGLLLRMLGVTDRLSGGTLRVEGRIEDALPAAPIVGTATVGRFVVLDAPLAARLVRDVSIYGWLAALPAPQLAVDRLVAPFMFQDDILMLADARAHSAALGVTMRGLIDLDHKRLDLKGTVVPAWIVNRLPGRLPVVGRLLSPEKEGGLLAATLTIRGPFAAPDMHVNALSLLMPGILRHLVE